jgi:hypothetical protein
MVRSGQDILQHVHVVTTMVMQQSLTDVVELNRTPVLGMYMANGEGMRKMGLDQEVAVSAR